MLNAIVLAALLQGSVAAVPSDPTTLRAEDVLAPIQVRPVRSLRPTTIALEAGYNGLSGMGLLVSRDFNPHIGIDVGGGFGGTGVKAGARVRYNLLKSNVTPFVALGALYGFGTSTMHANEDHKNTVRFKVDKSPMAQAVAGVSWVNRKGFSMSASAGYTQLLRRDNILIKDGTRPNDFQRKLLKATSGSGPTLALALGYAF